MRYKTTENDLVFYARCLLISNPDSLSSSEAQVNPEKALI
jgi:hypothetical protein